MLEKIFKEKKKKGCWARLALILLGLILIISAMIYVFFIYKPITDVDEKFKTLISKNYDTAIFSNSITANDVTNFNQKVRQSTQSQQELFDSENNLNILVFLSKEITFTHSLSLDKKDLAVWFNQMLALGIVHNEKYQSFLIGCQIYRLDISIEPTGLIYFNAVLRYDAKNSAFVSSNLYFEDLKEFYLTFSAEIDLRLTNSVKSVQIQVNRLIGEDNDYCLQKILQNFNLNQADLPELAYLPLDFIEKQASKWGITNRLGENCIILN